MAGSILGADQIAKVNAAYPRISKHIRALLKADSSAYGLMKVHFLTEYLDTTELSEIFHDLPFLAPAEKRALVRVAIFDVLVVGLHVMDQMDEIAVMERQAESKPAAPVEQTFTPPRFKLNVNTADAFHPRPADNNVAKPVVTSTHTPKVAEMSEKGDSEMKAASDAREIDLAVMKAREAKLAALKAASSPIVIAPTPDEAIEIPQVDETAE